MNPPSPPELPPNNIDAAVRGLMAPAFLMSQKYEEQSWRAVRKGADPDILAFEKLMIKACAKMGIPMFAHNMVRDAAHQNRLYVEGRTQAMAGESPHNFGMAVDIVHSTRAWDLTHDQWKVVGHLGKECARQANLRIAWGGDWKFYDPAHWEIADWRLRSAERQAKFDQSFWASFFFGAPK